MHKLDPEQQAGELKAGLKTLPSVVEMDFGGAYFRIGYGSWNRSRRNGEQVQRRMSNSPGVTKQEMDEYVQGRVLLSHWEPLETVVTEGSVRVLSRKQGQGMSSDRTGNPSQHHS